VSSTRFFVLATLAQRGEMHGHQIRLQAAEDRTDQWSDIKTGALYGTLTRLAREGLIAAIRSERTGNYPERTVYAITPEGRRAVAALHEQMLRSVVVPTDPFDLALAHPGTVAAETLQNVVEARLLDYRARLTAARGQLLAAEPWLSTAERAVCEHVIVRLETEVLWHVNLLGLLPKITNEPALDAPVGPPTPPSAQPSPPTEGPDHA
jgi:DNA-binding PadR family transcriptional regulator